MGSRNPVVSTTGAPADAGVSVLTMQNYVTEALAQTTQNLTSLVENAVRDLDLSTIPGTLPATRVTSLPLIGGVSYSDVLAALIGIDLKASQGGGVSAPVKGTAPTLSFPGGGSTGTIGQTPTLNMTSPFSGTYTRIDAQYLINGVVITTVPSVTNGTVLPAIPANAAGGTVAVNLLAIWSGPAVGNSSQNYSVSLPAAPVCTVQPLIAPANPTELTTLVPVPGTYTVNGLQVTPTLTYRWAFGWTLTTGLSAGATSATLNANWLGATGSYLVYFSNGDVRTAALTLNANTVTWFGGLSNTATSAVKVQVATSATLSLNVNNIGHTPFYYETPTYNGITGAEVTNSNTVTITDSTAGGSDQVEAGHRWLVSISAAKWTDYQTERALRPVTSGRTSQNAEARFNAIPAVAGTTLGAGVNATAVNNALNANTVVFLTQTVTRNTGNVPIVVPSGKALIGLGTGAEFDCSSLSGGGGHGCQMFANSFLVNVTIYRAPSMALWIRGNGATCYKVSLQQSGFVTPSWMSANTDPNLFDAVVISSECLNNRGGGEGDAWKLGSFGGGNCTYVDTHAFECEDDGFDVWSCAAANFWHFCTSVRNGKNTINPTGSGDGNGYKLGGPSGSSFGHALNRCVATDNGRVSAGGSGGCGFNTNSSLKASLGGIKVVLRLCTASGNQNGNYYFSDTPDTTEYFTIVSV